jgi:arylsulfatase
MKLLILISISLLLHSNHIRSEENDQEKRPNILLIVADDLGWSDMGSFGGEINTPNLDSIAFNGVRLTNFYTAPTCSPTRAMLLSGTDNHLAGLGNMEEELGPNQKGKNGYEGYLNRDVVSFAALLQDAGYRTMMSGKWHLGASFALGPESRGFDDAFVIANGISNHFKQERIVGFDVNTITKAPYRENGKEVTLEEPFYSSELYTDKLIEYIKDHQDNKDSNNPFFAYAAYSAPHWPLQAPQNFIEKYNSKYHIGYEEIRKERFKKMKKLGIINSNIDPVSSELWPNWIELDPETKKKEAKRMAVYAAMVEAMDFHIGRLIDFLEKSNALENTMIIFLSDNGAEGNDPRVILENRAWIPRNFDNSIENMGNFNSHISYGPKWAEVSASPYKGFKGFTSEGGIKSPAFITYKGFKRQKSINDAFLTVMDIAPTILEIANTEHPGEKYKERQVYPIKGKSMINFLMNERNSIHTENHVMGWELFNRIAIRRGNWKLVFIEPPHGNQKWSLYDLSQDPLEQNDLADIKSEILKEMISHWYTYRDQNGVIIDNDMRLGYSGSNSHYDH